MGTARGWGGIPTALAAFAAGSSVMVAVAIMMQFFYKMQSRGNLDPRTAVGKTARVYLKVPAQNAGKGKITVVLQGRSEEFSAVTSGDELPTGSDCRLVDMTTDLWGESTEYLAWDPKTWWAWYNDEFIPHLQKRIEIAKLAEPDDQGG